MSKLKKLIAVAVLLVLAAGAVFAYVCLRPEAQAGSKLVVLTVTHGDGENKEFQMKTDAVTLGDAMDELGIVEGEESAYGMFVTAVDGESADSALEQWWCFTKDGEMLMTGIDDTVISDGEHYEAVFTVGYDAF